MGKKKNKIIAKSEKSPSFGSQVSKRGKGRPKPEKFKDIVLRPDSDEERNDEYIDSKTTKKILRAFEKQKTELQIGSNAPSSSHHQHVKPVPTSTVRFQQKVESDESDSEVSDDGDGDDVNEIEAFEKTLEMDEADEAAFMRFQKGQDSAKTLTLADLIMDKLNERKTEIQSQFSDTLMIQDVDERVKAMYEGVKQIASRYRNGKLPKAFKVIPKLKNWEQILFMTEPQAWSSAIMLAATKIFSNESGPMFQRFLNLVLLPRLRDDLSEFNKLNPYLYKSLRRAIFKPASFFKGIILPLLHYGDCTIREAIVVGSVISKSSLPVLHSSACLLKICEMDYNAANSIFLKIIISKAYALPYRVVDAIVFHYQQFTNDPRELPSIWHQTLLTFVQVYKNDIASDQKQALLELLRKKSHPKLTPEIRRELIAAKPRDEVAATEDMAVD